MSASPTAPMPPWVLLRGLTREAGHWGGFHQQLVDALGDARVVALDLPGAGRHARVRCPLRVEAMMQACRRELVERGIAPPYVVLGLSLGGMVAAAWAAAHPGELAGCVLINTSMRPFSSVRQRLAWRALPALFGVLAGRDARRAERRVLGLTSAAPDAHAAVLDDWVAIRRARPVSAGNALRQLIAAARYRYAGSAPRVPVLVVHGAGDRLVDPRCSVALAASWGAERITHPSAGHDLPLDAGPWLAAQAAAWRRRACGGTR